MTDDPTAEIDRLHRQLRAMGAVNRQLHAQLEARPAAASARPRRVGSADPWLIELSGRPQPGVVEVVARASGELWLHEGAMRRRVAAGLLAPALEQHLGARRQVDDHELEQWPIGPPVEVLETPNGPPFLVVGGQRLTLRGLPVPFPVSQDRVSGLAEGPELNVYSAWRQGSRQASSGPSGAGAVRDLGRLARRAGRKGVRGVKRLSGQGH